MRARSGWLAWLGLAVCAVMLLGSMGWLSRGVIGSERERAHAEVRADLAERTRLALWRMDGWGAALILRERQLPVGDYLDTESVANFEKLRFELDPSGKLTGCADPAMSAELATLLASADDLERVLPSVARQEAEAADSEFSPLHKRNEAENFAAVPSQEKSKLGELGRWNQPMRQKAFDDAERESRDRYLQNSLNSQGYGLKSQLNAPAEEFPLSAPEQRLRDVPMDAERSDRDSVAPDSEDESLESDSSRLLDDRAGEQNSELFEDSAPVVETPPRPAMDSAPKLMRAQAPTARGADELQRGHQDDQSFGAAPLGILEAAEVPAEPLELAADTAMTQAMALEERAADLMAGTVVELWAGSDSAAANLTAEPEAPVAGVPEPRWIGGQLFLLRPVRASAGEGMTRRWVQGLWIESAALATDLVTQAEELLPNARLLPAEALGDSMVLASMPFRLELSAAAALPDWQVSSEIRRTLIGGWLGAGIAIAALGLLVHGILRLSERRASFVSAVTHELRTPLTTFKLYADLLAQPEVRPEKRQRYLKVLGGEADRLGHLVENVLAFSRIERRARCGIVRRTSMRKLLDELEPRLTARLATVGVQLETSAWPDEGEISTDLGMIEHILFNLIDNAAKYAVGGELAVVEIGAQEIGGWWEIRVSDHGPGIPASERQRIFRAFHKSAREAAESAPGVGLGLALSQRLARDLGGELRAEEGRADGTPGAVFLLRIKPG